MSELVIRGGNSLFGEFKVQGSKNAALPIMAAALLIDGAVELTNVPDITDVEDMCDILRTLGCKCERNDKTIIIDAKNASPGNVEARLTEKMRSSVFILGPLLARFGEANIHMPGGCAIGKRPIDLHLSGLRSLGAVIHDYGDRIVAVSVNLRGCQICLSYPSVGATENILMAAVLAAGITAIKGCAKEPEIVELCHFLNRCGAKITGIGSDTLIVQGVKPTELHPVSYSIAGDRIATGTYMYACAVCGGNVEINGICPLHLKAVCSHLSKMGCVIYEYENSIRIKSTGYLLPADVSTGPYPLYPTDMQPIAMAALTKAGGISKVTENVFEDRFKTADWLKCFGARLHVDNKSAIIIGVSCLCGTHATACDLRGGAALIIAGLMAEGESYISGLSFIDRGYERPEGVLRELGADICRR